METINYKGIDIEINQDEYPESPRDWDNLGTMVCFHSRYNLGDKHDYSIEDVQEIYNNSKEYISLPLFLYDHSGITMNTTGFSCGWDSGQVGVIFVSRKKVREEFNVKRISNKLEKKIISYLVGEVETYDQYLTGNVYWYNIDETNDSCSGYFGYDHEKTGLLEDAKASIDYYLKQKELNYLDKNQLCLEFE